ncbi:MAG: hypothetical protein ACK56W_12445, partial [Pirellula sp.]
MSSYQKSVALSLFIATLSFGEGALFAQIPAVPLVPMRRTNEALPSGEDTAQTANRLRATLALKPPAKTLKDSEVALLKADYEKL